MKFANICDRNVQSYKRILVYKEVTWHYLCHPYIRVVVVITQTLFKNVKIYRTKHVFFIFTFEIRKVKNTPFVSMGHDSVLTSLNKLVLGCCEKKYTHKCVFDPIHIEYRLNRLQKEIWNKLIAFTKKFFNYSKHIIFL